MSYKHIAAGILLFFDNNKTVLLGREFRKRYNTYAWMEFGGKHENGETLAETACREANEETAETLGITLDQVLEAEKKEMYVDYHNPKTDVFYRMYLVSIAHKPSLQSFADNAVGKSHVEMVEWRYFNIIDVFSSIHGDLPCTNDKIYETTLVRLGMAWYKGLVRY